MASRHKLRRLSLDTNCVNAKQSHPQINLLERWAGEGKIVLERSDVFVKELKGPSRIAKAELLPSHPSVWELGVPNRSELGVSTVLAGPEFGNTLRALMFPTTEAINSNQIADVDHMRDHIKAGADGFVTMDEDDFIRQRKQDDLRRFGIWVFTPIEAVSLLKKLYEWDS